VIVALGDPMVTDSSALPALVAQALLSVASAGKWAAVRPVLAQFRHDAVPPSEHVLRFRRELESVAEALGDHMVLPDWPSRMYVVETCGSGWEELRRDSPELEDDFRHCIAAVRIVMKETAITPLHSVSLDGALSAGSALQMNVIPQLQGTADRAGRSPDALMELRSWLLSGTHMEFTGRRVKAANRPHGTSGRSVVWQPSALAKLVEPPYDMLPEQLYDREVVLSALKRGLEEPDGNIHLICGAGGTGKSVTALAVADNARKTGMKVWWVQGTTESIDACMTAVALHLNADLADIAEARAGRRNLPDLVWERLESARFPWLLVIDNLDDKESLQQLMAREEEASGWIRPSRIGTVLVTSRHTGEDMHLRRLIRHTVAPFRSASAVAFLTSSAPSAGSRTDAAELAASLNYLPLACVLAVRYIDSPVTDASTFKDYLAELLELPHSAVARIEEGSGAGLLMATMRVVINSMNRSADSGAWSVLSVLAYCAPGAPFASSILDPDVFAEVGLPSWAVPSATRQIRVIEALEFLRSLGLTEPAPVRGSRPAAAMSFRVHPMISATCRSIVEDGHQLAADDQQRVWLAAAMTLHRAARGQSALGELNWADGYQLVPHIAALIANLPRRSAQETMEEAIRAAVAAMERLDETGAHDYAEQLGRAALLLGQSLPREHAAALSIAYALARTLMGRGRLGEAQKLLQDVLAARQRTLGLDHEASLDALELLASLLHRQGDLNQAEQILRQVANGRERTSGTASPARIRAMKALARILSEQGRLGEMERVTLAVAAAARSLYGPDNQETLSAETELGSTLRALGRLGESARILGTVLDTQARLFGEEDPDTISTLEEMAGTYRDQGRLTSAEEVLRRVLEIRRRTLGNDHTETINAMAELAETIRDLAQYEDAEVLLREVLHARSRVLGTRHPDTLNAQLGLAVILRDTGRYSEAQDILQVLVSTCGSSIGSDDPIAMSASHNLAAVFQDTGRMDEAEYLYREVLGTREWILGPNHPETLRTMVNLGSLLYRRGSLDEAEYLLRQAETACADIYGARHPYSSTVRNNIANILLDCGRLSEAQTIYKEIRDAQEEKLGLYHPDTLLIRVNQAVACAGQGKLAEAEGLLNEAVAGYHQAFGNRDHPSLLTARYHKARIKEQTGDLEAARQDLVSVFALQVTCLGDDHPDTIPIRLGLSRVLGKLGRQPEAEVRYQEAISLASRLAEGQEAARQGYRSVRSSQPVPDFVRQVKQDPVDAAAGEATALAAEMTPYVSAAAGAYGVAVLAWVQDDAGDAAASLGRKILQRVFGFRGEGELLPGPLAGLALNSQDRDALAGVRLAVRKALVADPVLAADVRSMLDARAVS
jgi:tetratricopeptide (TPR) repeat protein